MWGGSKCCEEMLQCPPLPSHVPCWLPSQLVIRTDAMVHLPTPQPHPPSSRPYTPPPRPYCLHFNQPKPGFSFCRIELNETDGGWHLEGARKRRGFFLVGTAEAGADPPHCRGFKARGSRAEAGRPKGPVELPARGRRPWEEVCLVNVLYRQVVFTWSAVGG